jgi:exonuclease VII large subunit
LEALNPDKVLERGYAILKGEIDIGNVVKITTINKEIKAEVKEVNER